MGLCAGVVYIDFPVRSGTRAGSDISKMSSSEAISSSQNFSDEQLGKTLGDPKLMSSKYLSWSTCIAKFQCETKLSTSWH